MNHKTLNMGIPRESASAQIGMSYDLIDRAVSPYVGIHWERSFGETAALARADGEQASSVYIVAGLKLVF